MSVAAIKGLGMSDVVDLAGYERQAAERKAARADELLASVQALRVLRLDPGDVLVVECPAGLDVSSGDAEGLRLSLSRYLDVDVSRIMVLFNGVRLSVLTPAG